jgi:nitrite reductase/ring-hydroxylating ferredoxin subunit
VAEDRTYPAFAESRVPHVGTYRRVLPVSLDRLYENALDWEHLPHVHSHSFASIECDASGPWGWRAHVVDASGRTFTLELRLDRECRRWITRTLAGDNAGSEIWTHAFATAPRRTDIVVDFFVPGVAADDRERIGVAFNRLYRALYDEDVAMMTERQRQIDLRIETQRDGAALALGPVGALSLPMHVEFDGRAYIVAQGRGGLIAHVARCPHQLGPLEAAVDGVVRCPWHGYRFDAVSGECLTGQPCRLPPSPRVSVREGGIVWVER